MSPTEQKKAEFKTELDLRDYDHSGRLFLVHEPLKFYSAELSKTLVVPAGTITDLASIPRWVRWIPGLEEILPQSGPYNRAAVLHDTAYHNGLTDSLGNPVYLSKKACDKLFLEAMLADGVGEKRAKAMYWAVKLFGRPDKTPVSA